MSTPILPRAGSQLVDRGGLTTREWYSFFSALLISVGEGSGAGAIIQQILQRLDALEAAEGEQASIIGPTSVLVLGSLAGGLVQIVLQGDTDTPGNSYSYGTGPDGVKGWFPLAGALAEGATMALTTGVDGITTFEQALLADTGAGAALVKITRDGYGRVAGTESADTDDLTEGATNLYFTDARAVAALEDTGPDYLQLLLDEYNP